MQPFSPLITVLPWITVHPQAPPYPGKSGITAPSSHWLSIFLFCQGFLSRILTTHKTTGEGRKPIFIPLYSSTTSTRSWTFRYLFAALHVRWLSHIFNRTVIIYQTTTRWDLPGYLCFSVLAAGPQLVFTSPGSQFIFISPDTQFVFAWFFVLQLKFVIATVSS